MKLWIISDLHEEIYNNYPRLAPPMNADIAVFAGDIHHSDQAIAYARSIAGSMPIIQIAGNHEYYHGRYSVEQSLGFMRLAAAEQRQAGFETYFLENETVILQIGKQKVRFIGATLWIDFNIFGNKVQGAIDAMLGLSDFRRIIGNRGDKAPLHPDEVAQWFAQSRQYIEDELRKDFDGRTVVVTHHLPSIRSVADIYRFVPSTSGFASRCDDLLEMNADLWIHGHTHTSMNYRADKTRVLCNPRGYERLDGYENRKFKPHLVVNI